MDIWEAPPAPPLKLGDANAMVTPEQLFQAEQATSHRRGSTSATSLHDLFGKDIQKIDKTEQGDTIESLRHHLAMADEITKDALAAYVSCTDMLRQYRPHIVPDQQKNYVIDLRKRLPEQGRGRHESQGIEFMRGAVASMTDDTRMTLAEAVGYTRDPRYSQQSRFRGKVAEINMLYNVLDNAILDAEAEKRARETINEFDTQRGVTLRAPLGKDGNVIYINAKTERDAAVIGRIMASALTML